MFASSSAGRSSSNSPSLESILTPSGKGEMPTDSAAGEPQESYSWKQIKKQPSSPKPIFRITSPLGASMKEIDVPRPRCPSLVSTSRASR